MKTRFILLLLVTIFILSCSQDINEKLNVDEVKKSLIIDGQIYKELSQNAEFIQICDIYVNIVNKESIEDSGIIRKRTNNFLVKYNKFQDKKECNVFIYVVKYIKDNKSKLKYMINLDMVPVNGCAARAYMKAYYEMATTVISSFVKSYKDSGAVLEAFYSSVDEMYFDVFEQFTFMGNNGGYTDDKVREIVGDLWGYYDTYIDGIEETVCSIYGLLNSFLSTYEESEEENSVGGSTFPSNFKIPESYKKDYPKFSKYVLESLPKLKSNNRVIDNISAYGHIPREIIYEQLEKNEGLTIVIDDNLKGSDGTEGYGLFNTKTPDKIYIDRKLVDRMENSPTQKETDGLLFFIGVTICHEFIHWGDYTYNEHLDGETNTLGFEFYTYDPKVVSSDGSYWMSPEEAIVIMFNFNKTH